MSGPVPEVVDRILSRAGLVPLARDVSVSAPAFDRPGDADVSVRERL